MLFVNCIYIYRTAPLLRPPFCDLLPGKKGGGRNNNDLRFCLTVKSPLPQIHVPKLCCAVEDENSYDRHAGAVLKGGRVVGHVHVATKHKHCSQTTPTGRDSRMTASGNRPRSVRKAKTSSQTIFYMLDTRIQLFYTCNMRTRARANRSQLERPTGGHVMEVKEPYTVISSQNRGGIAAARRNSEAVRY